MGLKIVIHKLIIRNRKILVLFILEFHYWT